MLKNNLKAIRRSKVSITQQDLADRVGCTRQTIIALEQHKYNPSLILALNLAEVLQTPVEDLFYLEDDDE